MGLFIAVVVALVTALLTGQVLARIGFPIPAAGRRIGCIDGLRGYLALLVMAHHFDLWTTYREPGGYWGNSSSLLFRNFGPGGVALFFMVTGLVFYPRIRRGFAEVDWRSTYISRLFRILPLQIVLIAIVSALSIALATGGGYGSLRSNVWALVQWVTSHGEPSLFGYAGSSTINAKVLWSLWFEWLFYFAVLPLLAFARDWMPHRIPSIVLPIAVLVALALQMWMPVFKIFIFLPLFGCGMVAFELRERAAVVRVLQNPWAAVVAGIVLALTMSLLGEPYFLPQIASYALFFWCIAAGNNFGGLFALEGSVVLGEISFGLYILHGLVLFVLFTFILPTTLALPLLYAMLPLSMLVAVLISAAAHLAIERPGIAWGKRLSGKPRERLSPRVEQAMADVAP